MAHNHDLHDPLEDKPLLPDGDCHEEEGELLFDEDGSMMFPEDTITAATVPGTVAARFPRIPFTRACSIGTLDGSWYLRILPDGGPFLSLTQTRGPMRIEASRKRIRISGDIYVNSPVFAPVSRRATVGSAISASSLVLNRNWYPAYPQGEYRWYFRSRGVRYRISRGQGKLIFKFTRHLWSQSSQEFVRSDHGWMEFECSTSIFRVIGLPQPTVKMTGKAMIGGHSYRVEATKTSPYYRGCQVEVDVMVNRSWPASATSCNGSRTFSFTSVYRSAGMDFYARVDETNIPQDNLLTSSELHNLLATRRSVSVGANQWKLWILVGSRRDGTYGIMFDQIAPHREGCVGFYDPRLPNASFVLPSARNQQLGTVRLAFLRTLIHEAGHCFNLYHPKHDVHSPAIGTTIMNQTGDVMGFATSSNPYPCNSTMGFNSHNRTSLIHSPDPQVKPGWKQFGWGHGSAFGGLPEPADALGIHEPETTTEDLTLNLDVPQTVFPGEYFTAEIRVTNVSSQDQQVTAALNLSDGDLEISVTDPSGHDDTLRDIVKACSDRQLIQLKPGEDVTANVQIVYTNRQFKFNAPGKYMLQARLETGTGHTLLSKKVPLVVREVRDDSEKRMADLILNDEVGLSLAFGDFGVSEKARDNLSTVMEDFGNTDTGAACAMVVANSYADSFKDVLEDKIVRKKDTKKSEAAWDIATKDRSAKSMACLASSIVSPREKHRVIITKLTDSLKDEKSKLYKATDRKEAMKLLEDFIA